VPGLGSTHVACQPSGGNLQERVRVLQCLPGVRDLAADRGNLKPMNGGKRLKRRERVAELAPLDGDAFAARRCDDAFLNPLSPAGCGGAPSSRQAKTGTYVPRGMSIRIASSQPVVA
jgi:hypothetical protein